MTNTAEVQTEGWLTVCESSNLVNLLGVRALINGEQVAIFRVKDKLFGISAFDPFSNAAVLSRGIVGDLQGQLGSGFANIQATL